MEHLKRITIEAGGNALCNLAAELDETHAAPFQACFFDEHWEAIERALDKLVNTY
ncbi:hypothetical protein OU994_17390 [Pseudoduganella sp. SL102]|uniref:hypothetical protein n=1 Tax=Pseudoduganella sp. SL102 TaxID=2995154 RepID=UPI00248BCE55|nr:hypothetical protein [Pseudoduganella sp. SL102]WBS00097.1 hypothetical protein OU994_17390 [Pseudoduganella sp. SL102]